MAIPGLPSGFIMSRKRTPMLTEKCQAFCLARVPGPDQSFSEPSEACHEHLAVAKKSGTPSPYVETTQQTLFTASWELVGTSWNWLGLPEAFIHPNPTCGTCRFLGDTCHF